VSDPRQRGSESGGSENEPHSHALAPDDFIRMKVKAELRKRMRGLRNTTPASACAERSAKICAALAAHEALKAAKSVALFWPIVERHEVDLRELDAQLRARGVRIAYPSIDPDTGNMTFRLADHVATLDDAGYGFAEPPKDAPVATTLDVVVVPALAADPTGHRIGYGAGYYDRTLPTYVPPAVGIAVAYDWQLIAEVPATAHDVRLAWVVTDLRVFDTSAS
jgi:5-formyltetrahydrofolate cyclo-ligase